MVVLKKFVFSFLLSVLLVSSALAQTVSVDKVNTVNGLISGKMSADGAVKIFRGIPYAAPPVGDLRWKEPQPLKNWKGIRKCDAFGPNAKQYPPTTFEVYTEEFLIPAKSAISEDCLYLNVWTTAESVNEKRAVIVFIHGGAFREGSGSVPIYDGEAMARKGVVFVTINYRVGVFGFYAHPELTSESPHKASGNYALMDDVAALNWIQNNIASFGGDPNNVTIAGQSAGSTSVNVLSVSPLAKGLFHKIIAESGASDVTGQSRGTAGLAAAEQSGLLFAKKIGANSLKELRQVSADTLAAAFRGVGNVIADGYVLPEPVSAMYASNKQSDVPLMTGYTSGEENRPAVSTVADYKKYLQTEFGDDASKLLQFYPAENDEQAMASSKYILRDRRFGLPSFSLALMQSEKHSQAFMYFFSRIVPEYGATNKYGAFHTGDIPYAYDNLKFLNRPLTDADHRLAKLMSSYWANFAKTGNPNGEGLPRWPAFDKQKGEVMIFDTASKAAKHPFFNGLHYFYEQAVRKP